MNSNSEKKQTVIIAGGGTGGHIYPGVAVARAVEVLHPELEVHFVGSTGGLEETIVPREGFPLHTVSVGRLHSSVGRWTQIKTLIKMPLAFWSAWKILRQLKPVAVLGVGGFASGPVLLIASLLGYRTLIWEPNAFPGWTNRILAKRVDECLVVFKEAGQHLRARKLTASGVPVRSVMVPAPRLAHPGFFRILIFGGSQGARFINNLVVESLQLGGWIEGVEVVHQTGPADFAKIKAAYAGIDEKCFQVFEYLHDMDKRFAWADLVICRSGASTVAEVCACEKAAIFIPLPTAADDHQTKNAQVLAAKNAALVCRQSELSAQSFRETIARFRDNPELTKNMEENVKQFQFPNAAEEITRRLLAGAKA